MSRKATKPSQQNTIQTASIKIGLNGVTTVHKSIQKEQKNNRISTSNVPVTKTVIPHAFEQSHPQKDDEELYIGNLYPGDEIKDVNDSHKAILLNKMAKISQCNKFGKLSTGNIIRFIEEAGSVVCTRFCNYLSAEHALNTGSLYEQVYCSMIHMDHFEILLPAFAGELLTCAAEISYTSNHNIEIKSHLWAEDLISSGKRLVCKASCWFVAYNINENWKITKVPKLSVEAKQEREGLSRFEVYKEERRIILKWPMVFKKGLSAPNPDEDLLYTPKHSETVMTHVADIHDCATSAYMSCGALIDCMSQCAAAVAHKHTSLEEVTSACGYKFHFLELIPKGSFLIIYAHLTFISKRLMEIEVFADMDIIAEQKIENKRMALGYFCFVALTDNGRMASVPGLKLLSAEDELLFAEGQRRYELMKKHLKQTDIKINAPANKDGPQSPVVASSKASDAICSTKSKMSSNSLSATA